MVRIHHVLCPIDFSDGSRRALDYAVALATWYHASISVLYVHHLSMPAYAAVPYIDPSALQPIALTAGERKELLASLEKYVAADRAAGIAIDTLLDEGRDISGAILSRASAIHADVIALGTHGRSGFPRFVLGSVTEKVLRKATCPVLTVPPHAPQSVPRAAVSLQRILCPIDFSESSTRALRYAASFASEAHARVTALHVVELPPDLSEPPSSGLTEYRVARFEQARKHLKDVIGTAVYGTCPVDELLLAGKAYGEILRVAADQAADLIVMGVHGRGVLDLLFFGSTTNHVVRQATCPVLTLRAE